MAGYMPPVAMTSAMDQADDMDGFGVDPYAGMHFNTADGMANMTVVDPQTLDPQTIQAMGGISAMAGPGIVCAVVPLGPAADDEKQ